MIDEAVASSAVASLGTGVGSRPGSGTVPGVTIEAGRTLLPVVVVEKDEPSTDVAPDSESAIGDGRPVEPALRIVGGEHR